MPIGPADTRGARALALHRHLLRLAFATGNIFGWIFVFRAFYIGSGDMSLALAGTAVLYAISQMIVIVLTPLSGAALRFGVRRALVYGTLAAAFAFLCISLLFADRANLFGLAASFAILMGMHRALYWMPYRNAQASFTTVRTPLALAREISIAVMPLLGGAIIESSYFGAPFLFAAAALGIIFALIPVIWQPETFERFELSFGETFELLFSRVYRIPLLIALLDGIQGAALLLVWPLAAFLILNQSFATLGFVVSLTLIMALAMRGFVRGAFSRLKLDRSRTVLSLVVFSSWLLRLSAGSFVQILLVDVYHHAGAPRLSGIDMRAADQAADAGHFVDEYTALKEIGMAMGRFLMCALFAALLLSLAAPFAFALCFLAAAVAAAMGVSLSYQPRSVY